MANPTTLIGGVVAVGVGEAAGTALEPVLEPQRQAAWAASESKILDLGTLAQLAAQGLISPGEAEAEGKRNGYAPSRVQRAIQLALVAAPVAELLELWRRDKISEALVDHGLAKAAIEPQYWPAIKELFFARLEPAQIALGIIRSVMADPGFMPVSLDTSGGVVPRYKVSPIDPLEEAKASGIDEERLRVMVGEIGLPMSAQQAASALFRKIIEQPDYYRAILEGDTRPEWADAILEQARQIPTVGEAVESRLRGWINDAEMYAQTARHGMSKADTDLLFKVMGRPIPEHQVVTGEARGGTFNGAIDAIPAPFLRSLQESNIRPEWYNLAYANRYSYPSAFVLRALLTGGVITAAQGEQYFLDIGWPPQLAKQVADHYGASTTAATNAHVTKADTQLWNTVHASYKAGESTAADVTAPLTLLGLDPATQTAVLDRWNAERSLLRKQLSPAQIKKAYKSQVANPATGVAWTLQDGINALLERGYDVADATVLLEE